MTEDQVNATLAVLQAYLPNLLAEQVLQNPEQPLLDRSERYPAAVLFADLAKFTPITEALCRVGVAGAEELTTLLNRYFSGQIAEVDHWGGVVGKFAGDAMSVLFRGEHAALRAVACAQALLQRGSEMAQVHTMAGDFELRMKLGLAYGEVLQMVVGNATRQEFIFAGEPLDASAQAEHHASPGEIVLSPSIQAALPAGRVECTALGDGFARLEALRGEVPARPNPPMPPPVSAPAAIQALRPFLPPQAFEKILLGAAGFVNEHRQVSVLFVNFEGINYALADAVQALGNYLKDFFAVVSRYDGYIRQVEMGDKGSKVIVMFGAPVAHEDDEERALLCALELQALAENCPAISAQCTGITTGKVFVGNLGASHRQEYAAMGDVVNLSARFMQAAAPQRILVDEASYTAAGAKFAWEVLEPIQVKGKSQPLPVFALLRRLHRQAHLLPEEPYALPMVGRQEEFARLQELLRSVREEGKAQVVGITAEAGMGKTRLATEVIGAALQMGYQGLRGNGLSHGASTPYLAWRPVLRALLDLGEERSILDQLPQIEAVLRQAGEALVARLPLLGAVLGVEIPDTEITASMDARLRRDSLFAMLFDLIRTRAAQAPLLLVLEDAHWLDDASRNLAQYLSAALIHQPVFLLTVYRPFAAGEAHSLWETPPAYFNEVRLQPFTPPEMRHLIEIKLRGLSLPPSLLEKIEQLSDGNPFYIDEFINLVQEQGIDLSDPQAVQALQVPDSIQTLVVTRLDQLAESEKMTVQVASVIGQLFRQQWLLAIYPGEMRQEMLGRDLARVHSMGIVTVDKPSPELEYLFKHAITQEVVYGTLSFANRRMLHERVAGYIEAAYAAGISAWYGILAYHFRRAERFEREYEFVCLAAQQAAREAAYRQAFAWFDQAVALQDAHNLGTPEQRFDNLQGRCEHAVILGNYGQALADAHTLRDLSTSLDVPRQVTALLVLGDVLKDCQKEENPRPYFRQAIDLARQHNDHAGLLKAIFLLGGTYFGSGDYQVAKEMLQQVIDEAGPADWRQKARAQQVLGWVVYDEGDYDHTRLLWHESYDAMCANKHKSGEALLLSNLGCLYSTIGEADKGLALYQQSLALAVQLGHKRHEAEALRLMGDMLRQAGQHELGWEYLERSITLGEQLMGEGYTLAYGWMCMAEILLETGGDLAQAQRLIDQALEIATPERGKELAGWVLHTAGRIRMRQGDYGKALEYYNTSLEHRRAIGQTERILATLADLALLHLAQGDLPAAQQAAAEMGELLGPADPQRDSLSACMACYRTHLAAGEPALASAMLERAYQSLQYMLGKIQSPAMRQSYAERIALHREILAEHQ
ncbi:MAG: tetratricopeptide repeat protein [Anaerolineales bacterium]|nr:tetratricopeptide repeat protein [Anaerolineales bacterium]